MTQLADSSSSDMPRTATRELVAKEVTAGYGSIPVIKGVDLNVASGEIVAILGPNGAGKTTLLMTLAGLLPLQAGTITMHGEPLTGPLHKRSRQGLGYISEQRAVFASLRCIDNLKLANGDLDIALKLFPELEPHLQRRVGLLSGGQQQMVALARALGGRPSVLLVDELSLGLAPLIVDRLLAAIRTAADEGTAILIVEQHAHRALEVADRAYVLNRGEVAMQGTAAQMSARIDEIEHSYLA